MHNKVKITSVPVRLAFLLLYGKHPWLEMVGDRVVIHDTYAAYMACALRKAALWTAWPSFSSGE